MNKTITPAIKELMQAVHYRPAVSIIMPFQPMMGSKAVLKERLKIATDKVELELFQNYPDEISMLVLRKLKSLISGLNFETHKKSIAIYVSPVFEKVLYLDIPLEERVIIDDSFEIRDLIYSKKQLHKYLVLLLSSQESRIYLGNSTDFVQIVSDRPEPEIVKNDSPELVANFSDKAEHKEIMMHKFLHHIDDTLEIILNAYHLPLFVLGAERVLGHFKNITKHAAAVTEYMPGNYQEATMAQLKEIIKPCISDWKKVIQKDLLNQLEAAAGKKKLAVGMREVWKEAINRKGRLLVVEKNYMYAAEHGSTDEVIYKAVEPYNKFSYIRDAVDDVIEKVLENGGDVEFVDMGLLQHYEHIALVQYY